MKHLTKLEKIIILLGLFFLGYTLIYQLLLVKIPAPFSFIEGIGKWMYDYGMAITAGIIVYLTTVLLPSKKTALENKKFIDSSMRSIYSSASFAITTSFNKGIYDFPSRNERAEILARWNKSENSELRVRNIISCVIGSYNMSKHSFDIIDKLASPKDVELWVTTEVKKSYDEFIKINENKEIPEMEWILDQLLSFGEFLLQFKEDYKMDVIVIE